MSLVVVASAAKCLSSNSSSSEQQTAARPPPHERSRAVSPAPSGQTVPMVQWNVSTDSDPHELSTVARPRIEFSPLPAGRYQIRVVEGPDSGAVLSIDGSEPSRVLVGQSEACGLRLTDRSVSRRHLALDVQGRKLRVTDLESTNGTFVDGVGVYDAWLRGGETLRLGGSALRVEAVQEQASAEIVSETRFGKLLGASVEMRRLYPLCERLAATNLPVLIEGETGTGKEVLAEAIHEQGPRSQEDFVVFDCTTVPANLIESELFGHERGAFTGATERRIGLLEAAAGGTLFIDEIGDLSLELQPKLLRAIERSEFRRVGGRESIRVDVRIISATRRNLDGEVQARRFRDDLYHRLAVARVELPPLRQRRGDIAFLSRHFIRELGGSTDLPADLLLRWSSERWPGNVRELRNAVARHLALGELAPKADSSSANSDTPLDGWVDVRLPLAEARRRLLERFEAEYVRQLLERHGGNVSQAARAAGIGRRYLQKLKARER